jgi:TfoX/Sxy family transcriptional regulator of competence genes
MEATCISVGTNSTSQENLEEKVAGAGELKIKSMMGEFLLLLYRSKQEVF